MEEKFLMMTEIRKNIKTNGPYFLIVNLMNMAN